MTLNKITDGETLKILFLEDSIHDFELIREQLSDSGYNLDLTHVVKESEFVSCLQNHSYDIILSDFKLPGFDAFGALQHSRELCPDVPLICISGSIGEEKATELLKSGAVDYVLKDRPERLPFAIKRALQEQKEKKALKLAEEELKRKEANFRTLAENIPDIIARFDKSLRHIYINPAIEKVTGISPVLFIGKTNEELDMPEENVALWNENMRYVFQTGKQRIFEFEFQSSTGTSYFSSMIVPELGEDGKVNTILTVTRDISENKMAEIALKKSEERLRDIVFSTVDWVWEVDKDGKYTYSSQKGIELLGSPNEFIIGKTPFDFMPEDEVKRVSSVFAEIIAKKAPIKDLENWNIRKNGELICLLTNGLPILDDKGQLIGYRGIDKDITERKVVEQQLIKAKEKAEESDKLKTAFINNISHEIRTPLNGILGFGELLTRVELTQEERMEMLAHVQDSSDRLMNTVSDYMDIAKIVSGTMEVRNKEFHPDQLFQKITEKTQNQCTKKNIGLEIVVPSRPNDLILFSDSEFILKTLNILLDNALKFTKQGTIRCGYRIEKSNIEFFVEDTGIGIAPDKLEIIFEMFNQVDSSNTRGYEGSGLGLTIARGLIKLLDGSIHVTSELGKGSIFTFSVPLTNNPIIQESNSSDRKKFSDKNKPLILVVEDIESNYLYMQILLKLVGSDYLLAKNGAEAVNLCRLHPDIALVLMDIKMPEMNGIEATGLIREFRPELPIIATTAYAQTGDENRFLAAGFTGYIAKPIKKDKLYDLIKVYI